MERETGKDGRGAGCASARRIFFVGARGSGKTTVGKALAKALGWLFADTDALVEEEAGISIAAMVEKHGWEYFRARERDALKKACSRENVVVATGGGMVLHPANREDMRAAGHVVWLKTDAAVLVARIESREGWESRPSLTGASPAQEMENVLLQRTPLYDEAAHLIVDAALPVAELVEAIRRHGTGT